MSKLKSLDRLFDGRHFDREIILLCVRWYLRYKLSLRFGIWSSQLNKASYENQLPRQALLFAPEPTKVPEGRDLLRSRSDHDLL